ncbi:FecR family protein [Pseudobacter ginsenosidimutans]|uniref:FecR family protein n=1 Tax=Pseudobacter ginsenosidimutans TaxID=661488 RepID=A0A4Q7MZ39_9BACT|nr:FecR domain-containing protein [Pseudobacter ginsenosidimutans]QEC43169.1 FecR family protein [Pseudobacter ginsenosidimutans]RZS74527.1 FecR family protein [Pseudobacter ginsenosidimutans]
MSTPSAPYDELINRFVTEHLQPEEVDTFFAFLEEEGFRERYGNRVEQDLLQQTWEGWKNAQQAELLYQKIVQAGGIKQEAKAIVMHRSHFLRTAWFRYAAAVALLIIGAAAYFIFRPAATGKELALKKVEKENIVLPGSNKAVLTLSNGQKMDLGKDDAGTIRDGAMNIENQEGQLIYAGNATMDPGALNTITTPNGGMFQLLLSDGTKVWLNAASSITYPVAFSGSRREVSITGEAYFEVKQQKNKPFIVKTAGEEITVLGTAFNVNSYTDEPSIRTSLVEGAVKINNTILKPGQAYSNGVVAATDVRQDIAWKSGYFDFDKLPFDQALRQLARWYDVKIVYENGIPREEMFGKMERTLTLNDALGGLDGTVATFRLEGNTVRVTALLK